MSIFNIFVSGQRPSSVVGSAIRRPPEPAFSSNQIKLSKGEDGLNQALTELMKRVENGPLVTSVYIGCKKPGLFNRSANNQIESDTSSILTAGYSIHLRTGRYVELSREERVDEQGTHIAAICKVINP